MKNLSNYIQTLDFEYAISYSGFRGEKFIHLREENQDKIQQIKQEIKSARLMESLKLKKKIDILSQEINDRNSRIINQEGTLHKSAISVHRFEKGDEEIKSIFRILKTKLKEQCVTICAPVYRDALVFYSKKGNIVGILQICFSCFRIEDENRIDFEVDHKIYSKLKKELIQLGHQIED